MNQSWMQTLTAQKMTTVRSTQSSSRLDTGIPPKITRAHSNGQFNQGQSNPATWAARLKGQHLASLRLIPHLMHPMATGGLAPTTIKGHRKALRQLSEEVTVDLQHAPLPNALLELINRKRRQRHWKWTTTVTHMSTIQGALALLPVYATLEVMAAEPTEPILLKHCPVWTMAMRAATRKAREQIGKQPKAATAEHVKRVLQNAQLSPEMRACILLSWVTGSRCGDVLKLRMTDFKMDQQKVMITFCRGKTVAKRGAYTVSSYIPTSAEANSAKRYLQTTKGRQDSPLFPNITGRAIKQALRSSTGDQLLEQRSLRRGALQELAAQGMALSTLLLFSGHTTIAMLLRYLGHGTKAVAQNNAMIDAARVTFG